MITAMLIVLVCTAAAVLLYLVLSPVRGGVESQDRPKHERVFLREHAGNNDSDTWRANLRGGVEE